MQSIHSTTVSLSSTRDALRATGASLRTWFSWSPLLVLMTLSLTILTSGCTKKEHTVTKGENKLLSEALLKKLPTSAAGFSVMDLSGDGYKTWKASPYGDSKDVKKSLDSLLDTASQSGATEAQLKLIRGAFESLAKLGMISPNGEYTPEKLFSKVVLFSGPSSDPNVPVDGGLFAQAAPNTDLKEKVKIVQGLLTESGLTVTADTISNSPGLIVSTEGVPMKLYIAASTSTLGVTLTRTSLEALLASSDTQTLAALRALPEFHKAVGTLTQDPNPVAFGFVSLKRLQPLLETVSKMSEASEFKPQDLPLDAVAFQTSFAKQYVSRVHAALSPRNESQTKVLTALEGASLPSLAAKLPANTAVGISLDTKMVAKLDSFLQAMAQETDAQTVEQTKKLQGVTIGLRNNTAGSPIPDIYVSLDTTDREEAAQMVKAGLGLAMSVAGQNVSWQTKEVDGAQTNYFTTLIGAGVFVSSPKDSKALFIGSSEAVIKDLLAAQSGRAPAYAANLPAPLKTQLDSTTLASVYLNFPQIADIGDSLRSTLAMFTGGSSEINEALDLQQLRRWGVGVAGVSYAGGVLSIQSALDFSPSLAIDKKG